MTAANMGNQKNKLIIALFIVLTVNALPAAPEAAATLPLPKESSILFEPEFEAPTFLELEWSFPTRFTVGIIGEYILRQCSDTSSEYLYNVETLIDLFPCYFLMKYSLYETPRLSQSIGLGLGPYFWHQGPGPPQMDGLKLTGNSTCIMEWISQISQHLSVNLSMKYTHAFQAAVGEVPLRSFSTWLSLQLYW